MHYASPILPNMFYVWILACIIFFHHQILYGLTDYGVKLSSNCKEPELYI